MLLIANTYSSTYINPNHMGITMISTMNMQIKGLISATAISHLNDLCNLIVPSVQQLAKVIPNMLVSQRGNLHIWQQCELCRRKITSM